MMTAASLICVVWHSHKLIPAGNFVLLINAFGDGFYFIAHSRLSSNTAVSATLVKLWTQVGGFFKWWGCVNICMCTSEMLVWYSQVVIISTGAHSMFSVTDNFVAVAAPLNSWQQAPFSPLPNLGFDVTSVYSLNSVWQHPPVFTLIKIFTSTMFRDLSSGNETRVR